MKLELGKSVGSVSRYLFQADCLIELSPSRAGEPCAGLHARLSVASLENLYFEFVMGRPLPGPMDSTTSGNVDLDFFQSLSTSCFRTSIGSAGGAPRLEYVFPVGVCLNGLKYPEYDSDARALLEISSHYDVDVEITYTSQTFISCSMLPGRTTSYGTGAG
jgi:hypothetical protein